MHPLNGVIRPTGVFSDFYTEKLVQTTVSHTSTVVEMADVASERSAQEVASMKTQNLVTSQPLELVRADLHSLKDFIKHHKDLKKAVRKHAKWTGEGVGSVRSELQLHGRVIRRGEQIHQVWQMLRRGWRHCHGLRIPIQRMSVNLCHFASAS